MNNTQTLESFRKTLLKRLFFATVYFLIIIAAALFLILGNVDSIAMFFALGFGCGIAAIMMFFIVKYIAALGSRSKLEKLLIEENDERSRFIEAKVGSKAINAAILVLSLSMLISNFFDQQVFLTLLAATLIVVIIKFFFRVYYGKKY